MKEMKHVLNDASTGKAAVEWVRDNLQAAVTLREALKTRKDATKESKTHQIGLATGIGESEATYVL